MKIGLSLKLVFVLLLLFACTTVGAIFFMQKVLLDNHVQYRNREVSALAKALDESINRISPDTFDLVKTRMIDMLASQSEGRIRISDSYGKVYYDSRHIQNNLFLDKQTELRISDKNPNELFLIRVPEELETVYYPSSEIRRFMGRLDDVTFVYFAPVTRQSEVIGQILISERATTLGNAITKVRDNLFITMSVFFLVFSVIVYFIVNYIIVSPLHSIENVSREIVAGDLSTRFEIKSNDEVSLLSNSLNTMIHNFEKTYTEVSEKCTSLQHFASELEAKNEELNRKQKLIDFDLHLAHNIQQELLPQVYPRIDGVAISAANFQVGEIGGDCFDFYKLGDNRLGTFIGDVSGKGIAAALVMSMVTILFSQLKDRIESPAKILATVNDIMYRHFGSRHSIYLTCFYMNVDIDAMEITFSCAGHNPPILHRKKTDEIIQLESEGFGLGMFSKVPYQESTMKILPGDKIIFFTDGVTDTRNVEGDMYGLQNLIDTIKKYKDANSFRLTHLVVEELEEFAGDAPRQDDLTMIVYEVKE